MPAKGPIDFIRLSSRVAVAALYCGVSGLAVGTSTSAFAQTAPEAPPAPPAPAGSTNNDQPISESTSPTAETSNNHDIVVTGIRGSLANSQSIKRKADTFVDAITAVDMGALPDRSVTEALQRVPGVSISRFQGSNDPDHFSVEGTGVAVRGLTFVRSELNGRDTFSANSGRALGFEDVTPELLGSVEVFKNLTADMIEGGLAGTVNLNTRVPFDEKGQKIYLSGEVNYGDFRRRATPNVSGLYSNQWDTSAGRFGLLASIAYSRLESRSDGISATRFDPRTDIVPGSTVFVPIGGGVNQELFDRRRFGIAAAAQWQSPNESMLATLQYLRSDFKNSWTEHAFAAVEDAGGNPQPAPGTTFQFNGNGVFQSGTLVNGGGAQQKIITRGVNEHDITSDYGANFKWKASDRLSFNFDGQYVKSSTNVLDMSVIGSTFANTFLDLSGRTPVFQALAPNGGNADAFFSNPANTFYRAAMDHIEKSDGHEWAFKGDATYDFSDDDDHFFNDVKFGARYSTRDQDIRYTAYNWGVLSEVWDGGVVPFSQGAADISGQPDTWSNFFRGDTPNPTTGLFLQGNVADRYQDIQQSLIAINHINGGGTGWVPLDQRPGVIAGTPFLPGDLNTISERTEGAYIRLDFGQRHVDALGGIGISGNIGVRYVDTRTNSLGSLQFPDRNTAIGGFTDAQLAARTTAAGICHPAAPNTPPGICSLSDAQLAALITFANGQQVTEPASASYRKLLPSFNLKVGLTNDFLIRFAYSKAISRPDLGLLRNHVQIGGEVNSATSPPGVFDGLSAAGTNPTLRPITADQFDLSGEWYFARVGSLTLTGFYKKLTDFLVDSAESRNFTNNGVTQSILVTGAVNAPNKGTIKGFELAYQQTFTFLPAPFDGLGVNANYTYVKSSGIPNSFLKPDEPATGAVGATTVTGHLPLTGLSKHNINLQAFYEKGPLQLRVAYSWRSKYLLTVRDVNAPFLPTYSGSTGQLDASVFVNIGTHMKFGVQAVNLLNETTKTLQQLNDAGLLAPRSYFMNDRRFSAVARLTF